MHNPPTFDIDLIKFTPYNHSINGTISHTIDSYLNGKIPLQKLLYDYNAITSTPGLLDELFNNWRYYCDQQNIPYVCGVSEEEARFNLEAMSLKSQKPINVIKSIYYRNKHLNDSGIERTFLGSISNHISSNNTILVVNPSPIAIEQIESMTSSALYAVPDKVLSSLYSKQFKCSRFMDMEEALNINSDIDSIVLFTSPSDEELLDKIMRILSSAHSKKVFAIMQTRLIDNKKSSLWEAITHRNYRICDIVIVPNALTNTSPKKKCFMLMTSVDIPNTQIHRIDYEPQSKLISLSSKEINESWEAVRDSKLTINKIWDNNSVISISSKKDPVYSKAQLFAFTNEIQISYALYSNKHRSYVKTYYAETKNTVIPSIRGKSLTNRKERYLADTSEEALSTILEEIPYIDSFMQAISQDILENYLNTGIPVALKTLWFVCRKELSHNTAYNDEILREVFSNKSDLCTINVDSTSTSQIEICVHKLFSEGEEAKELSFLKQLNLLVNTAITNGYISNNHILPLIPAASNRASKRQAEARQALAKTNSIVIDVRFRTTRRRSLRLRLWRHIRASLSQRLLCDDN